MPRKSKKRKRTQAATWRTIAYTIRVEGCGIVHVSPLAMSPMAAACPAGVDALCVVTARPGADELAVAAALRALSDRLAPLAPVEPPAPVLDLLTMAPRGIA